MGAVQALYENDILPEIIAGVSAGSLAGVFLADGKEPHQILELFEEKEFGDFTKFAIRAKGGFMLLDQLHDFIYGNLSVRNIEQLRIPLIVTATNLDDGVTVHFHEGEIAPRIAASCCVPGLFTPVKVDGSNYIDGGVLMNLPVSVIRGDCEKIVAVNVSPIISEGYKMNVVNVLQRTYHLMSHSNILLDRSMADVLIETHNLNSYANTELDKAREIFDRGYEAAKKVLAQV